MALNQRLHNNYDFLRVFAALCITFTHSFGLLNLYDKEYLVVLSNRTVDFSFIGLCCFFSISGYLIAKSAFSSTSFKNYLWKRFLRIQPLLIVVCLLSVFILGPVFTTLSVTSYFENSSTYTYFRNIMPVFGIQFHLPEVFQHNMVSKSVNGSMWTLIVEERLYLLVALLFLMKRKSKNLFLCLVGSLNILYFINHFVFHKQLISYFNGANVFYAFIFLNASCYFLLNINFSKISKSVFYYFGAMLILLLALYVPFKESMQVLAIPFLVIMIANIKGWTNNAGRYGDFTYGIYIFSFPVQQILITLKLAGNSPLKLFLLTLAIVLPLAILSWHLLEKKMLLLKEKVR